MYQSQSNGDHLRSNQREDGRPTLRRRNSRNEPAPRSSNGVRINHSTYIENDRATIDATIHRKHKSKRSTSSPVNRLARSVTLIILCILICYGSIWGVRFGISLAKNAPSFVFGGGGNTKQSKEANLQSATFLESEKESINARLRGASASQSLGIGGMSRHDLNSISHSAKERDENIFSEKLSNDEEQDFPDEKEGYQYMGKDATADFFYVGNVMKEVQTASSDGDIEVNKYPAQSYATLPFTVDSNTFVLSVWIYLSPEKTTVGIDNLHEDERPQRVILSTRTSDTLGCKSDIFGSHGSGMVLYAQPHYSDSDGEDSQSYHIALEYATTGSQMCRTLVGSKQSNNIVRTGEWYQVVVFVTRTTPSEVEERQGVERISLYVGGDLAAREARVSNRISISGKENRRTVVGRYDDVKNSESDCKTSTKYSDLGGRVGMLSFWEIGGARFLTKGIKRMNFQSEHDEDHVVRAINRAAFDVRAIQELSLQGLTVKEPTLLYTFDGQHENNRTRDSSESSSTVKEVMSGNDGEIVVYSSEFLLATKTIQDTSIERKPFAPLGGNRYAEYNDGTYQPPKWTPSELRQLDDVARARSVVVKEAMRHAWNGYRKYAWGKDEVLPLTHGGQNNWGGQGTTLVDSLR